MTRRQFLSVSSVTGLSAAPERLEVVIPIHQIMDGRVKWRADQVRWFQSILWEEAVRDLMKCGVRLETTMGVNDMWRPPDHEPEVNGLRRGVINFVITHQIPMHWDRGRALSGVTTRYHGHHVCMVALNHAHAHRIPFVSVNTCVHELLHALLHDIFEDRPRGLFGEMREFRVDFEATRLWLLDDGATIRKAAQAYLMRLQSDRDRQPFSPGSLLRAGRS